MQKGRLIYELNEKGLWSRGLCFLIEDEGGQFLCCVVPTMEAAVAAGGDQDEVVQLLEEHLTADMKERAKWEAVRFESGWPETTEGMKAVPPDRRREYALKGLGYARLPTDPEVWRKTLDQL